MCIGKLKMILAVCLYTALAISIAAKENCTYGSCLKKCQRCVEKRNNNCTGWVEYCCQWEKACKTEISDKSVLEQLQLPDTLGNEIVQIGILAPFTGLQAEIGNEIKRGINIALQEYKNKTNQQPIDVILVDTECKPDLAVEKLRNFVNSYDAGWIIGPVCQPVRNQIADEIRNTDVIALSLTDPGLDIVNHENMFNLSPEITIASCIDSSVEFQGIPLWHPTRELDFDKNFKEYPTSLEIGTFPKGIVRPFYSPNHDNSKKIEMTILSIIGAKAYIATEMILNSMEFSNDLKINEIIDRLTSTTIETKYGPVSFTTDGYIKSWPLAVDIFTNKITDPVSSIFLASKDNCTNGGCSISCGNPPKTCSIQCSTGQAAHCSCSGDKPNCSCQK